MRRGSPSRSLPRVLVAASSCFKDGGVQAAASLIDEISDWQHAAQVCEQYPRLPSVSLEVSREGEAKRVEQIPRGASVLKRRTSRQGPSWAGTSGNDYDVEHVVVGLGIGPGGGGPRSSGLSTALPVTLYGSGLFPAPFSWDYQSAWQPTRARTGQRNQVSGTRHRIQASSHWNRVLDRRSVVSEWSR